MNTTNKENETQNKTWGPMEDGIRQYLPTGVWHCKLKINGEQYGESTGQKLKSLALKVKNQKIAEWEKNAAAGTKVKLDRTATFATLLARVEQDINNHTGGKGAHKTVTAKLTRFKALKRDWLECFNVALSDTRPADLSSTDLATFRKHLIGEEYCRRTLNDLLTTLRTLFRYAVEAGIIYAERNPALSLKPAKKRECPETEKKNIFSVEQIEKVLSALNGGEVNKVRAVSAKYRDERGRTDWTAAFAAEPELRKELVGDLDAAKAKARLAYLVVRSKGDDENSVAAQVVDFCEALAFTGLRLEEAQTLRVQDVDLKGKKLKLRDENCKFGHGRTVPILDRVLPLFARLVRDADKSGDVFKVKVARQSLAAACERAGLPHLTHHGLRHFFASYALAKSNFDFKSVAKWLGHKDGGKLLIELYSHSLEEYEAKALAAINAKPENVVALPVANPALDAAATLDTDTLRRLLAERDAAAAPVLKIVNE